MEDRDVIAHLASGAALRKDDYNTSARLVTIHADVAPDQWARLADQGWLRGFPNGMGAWLSDEGRLAYLRSTDEMGDGKLVPPVTPNVGVQRRPAPLDCDPQDGLGPSAATTGSASS